MSKRIKMTVSVLWILIVSLPMSIYSAETNTQAQATIVALATKPVEKISPAVTEATVKPTSTVAFSVPTLAPREIPEEETTSAPTDDNEWHASASSESILTTHSFTGYNPAGKRDLYRDLSEKSEPVDSGFLERTMLRIDPLDLNVSVQPELYHPLDDEDFQIATRSRRFRTAEIRGRVVFWDDGPFSLDLTTHDFRWRLPDTGFLKNIEIGTKFKSDQIGIRITGQWRDHF